MEQYAPPPTAKCRNCELVGEWRCRDCFRSEMLCRGCCRRSHHYLPFHRVERWNGSFFEHSTLWEVGVRLYLGHEGRPCPSSQANTDAWTMEQDMIDQARNPHSRSGDTDVGDPGLGNNDGAGSTEDLDYDGDYDWDSGEGPDFGNEYYYEDLGISPQDGNDEIELDEQDEEVTMLDSSRRQPPTEDSLGGKFVIIVDSSGVHHLPAIYCNCTGCRPHDEQAMGSGLFPTSFTSISTLFTFAVLDHCRLENLECKTTPYQFYQKLRRMTNSSFPQSVPNRYAELRRLTRQWRQLKKRKWHGMPYDPRPRGPGEMAIFCAACPQPGINLKPQWIDDKDK